MHAILNGLFKRITLPGLFGLAGMVLLFATETAHSERLRFGVIGDTPYSGREEPLFERFQAQWQVEDLAFVVHVGDFKSGSARCDDAVYLARARLFAASPVPLIYTPGDNDWTDCHRPAAGGYDPLERLQALRRLFYPTMESLGKQAIKLERQTGFPENQRWYQAGIVYMSMHVVGSQNGLHPPVDTHFDARMAANLDWLGQGFAKLRETNAAGMVLFLHADMQLEGGEDDPRRHAGYAAILTALKQETASTDIPILLIHGDGHRFRVDKPWEAQLPHLTRIEVFGSPMVNYVRVDADTTLPGAFRIHVPSLWNEP